MPSYKEQIENYKKFKKEEDPSLDEQLASHSKSVAHTVADMVMDPSSYSRMRAKERSWKAAQEAAKSSSKGMKKGGMVRSSASKRADGCAVRGKTKGKMV